MQRIIAEEESCHIESAAELVFAEIVADHHARKTCILIDALRRSLLQPCTRSVPGGEEIAYKKCPKC